MIRHNSEIEIGNYKFIYKEFMTDEEWLDTRTDGIGGSDVGVIMGVNPWMSPTRLFYEKLGLHGGKDLTLNDAIFWGKMDEDNIRIATEYWDVADPRGYMRNFYIKKKTAAHLDFPFFIINKEYPWLRANVDGLGFNDVNLTFEDLKNQIFNLILPEPEKVVEIKTIKGRSRDRWAHGIPIGYIYQVLTYMMVCRGMNPDIYGEIYSKVDGSELSMHTIPDSEIVRQDIIEQTGEFWSRVEEGLSIIEAGLVEEEMLAEIMNLEPEPDGTKDYSDFLSERELEKIQEERNSIMADDKFIHDAEEYQRASAKASEITAEKQLYGNKMKAFMRKNNASIVNIEGGGKVSLNKRLYVNIAA